MKRYIIVVPIAMRGENTQQHLVKTQQHLSH